MASERRILLPAEVAREIGRFGVSRGVVIALLTQIHIELPNLPDAARKVRMKSDERLFLVRIVIAEDDVQHVFSTAIDDVTAPDHWIVAAISHAQRRMN